MKGSLIVFEGLDGSGKTTQAKLLTEALNSKGLRCLYARDPGSTHLGQELRSLLLENKTLDMSPEAEMCLFNAARFQMLHEIITPSLNEGCVVVLDRFYYSTIAYQGAGRELGREYVSSVCNSLFVNYQPDLVFYLEASVGLLRERQVAPVDKIESENDAFFERVSGAYNWLWYHSPSLIFKLSAWDSEEKLSESVLMKAELFLESRK